MDERVSEEKALKHFRCAEVDYNGKINTVTFTVGDVVTYKPEKFTILKVMDGGIIMGMNMDYTKSEVVQLDWREIEHADKVNAAVFQDAHNRVEIVEEEETPACVTERRYGLIEVSEDVWQTAKDKIIKLCELYLVKTDSITHFTRANLIIRAYSPHFEPVQEGCQIPFYNPVFSNDENGKPFLKEIGTPYCE